MVQQTLAFCFETVTQVARFAVAEHWVAATTYGGRLLCAAVGLVASQPIKECSGQGRGAQCAFASSILQQLVLDSEHSSLTCYGRCQLVQRRVGCLHTTDIAGQQWLRWAVSCQHAVPT